MIYFELWIYVLHNKDFNSIHEIWNYSNVLIINFYKRVIFSLVQYSIVRRKSGPYLLFYYFCTKENNKTNFLFDDIF